jgi:gluconolactonase
MGNELEGAICHSHRFEWSKGSDFKSPQRRCAVKRRQFISAGPAGLAVASVVGAADREAQAQAAQTTTIDLMKVDGQQLAKVAWKYKDVKIVGNDLEPRAHGKDFDDSQWETITDLGKARGPGKLSFAWYRCIVTIPEKIGDFDPTGSTVTFETTVDDYGEVYVDGKIDLAFGKSGAGAVSGFNAPNKVTVGKNVKSGDQYTIAIFGANGPRGNPPGNFIFLRKALLTFSK